jgi:hypothetical protein
MMKVKTIMMRESNNSEHKQTSLVHAGSSYDAMDEEDGEIDVDNDDDDGDDDDDDDDEIVMIISKRSDWTRGYAVMYQKGKDQSQSKKKKRKKKRFGIEHPDQ